MKTLLNSALVAALVAASTATPALAQGRDNRHQPQVRQSQSHGHARFREVTVTHGHKWRKGQRLNRNQQRYVVNDWSRRGLRAPPRGYRWVRENNNSGDYLLVAAATGLIASILSQ